MSPHEAMTGRKPDVSLLVPLGYPAYATKMIDKSTDRAEGTFRTRAEQGKVVGYHPNYKGAYWLLLPDGTLKVRRDLAVNETEPSPLEPSPVVARQAPLITPIDESQVIRERHTMGKRRSSRHDTAYMTSQQETCFTGATDGIHQIDLPETIPKDPIGLVAACNSTSPHYHMWKAAAAKELKKFCDKSIIEPITEQEIGNNKVIALFSPVRYKIDNDNKKLIAKVRIVFDGSRQIKGEDYAESYSPTLSDKTFKTVLHISKIYQWHSYAHTDIDNAYLQAIDNNVFYVRLPAY